MLDDNPDLCRLYKRQIEHTGNFAVTAETDGARARQLAERQLFDVVIIDAKLDYRSHEFGGLRLADDLSPRYGANSILVISRYVTADLVKSDENSYDFMEKSNDLGSNTFCESLCRRLSIMRRRQYVFVAMPFAKGFIKLYRNGIKPGITLADYKCVRIDEIPHNRRIHDVIFELVQKSKLVVFAADGGNANAYYEAGFADAMHKEVVIVASSLAELKFDISNRSCLFYGKRPEMLPNLLAKKLKAIRLSNPVAF